MYFLEEEVNQQEGITVERLPYGKEIRILLEVNNQQEGVVVGESSYGKEIHAIGRK